MVSWVGDVNQIQKNVNTINFTAMTFNTETNQQQQRKRKSDQTKLSLKLKMEV